MQLKTFEDRETFKTLKDENESDEVVEEVKWITSSKSGWYFGEMDREEQYWAGTRDDETFFV